MIRPKTEAEDSLLSITKNYETLIKQTHTEPQETLEFRLTKARKFFLSSHQTQLTDLA